ncbi:MAG: TlpA family protein disulfide reductase, partial [Ktedonobacterales bacterium]
ASLLNLSNKSVRLSSMRGQVVVLNFWYVACEPCRYEMPALEKAYLAHKSQGLAIVGVNTSDDAQTISDFTNQIGITYPILRDLGERVTIQYKVTATPTTFVLDRHGVIRAKIAGPLDNDAVAKYVLPLLTEK